MEKYLRPQNLLPHHLGNNSPCSTSGFQIVFLFVCFRSYDMHALFKGNRRSQAKIEAELLWLKLGGRSWLVKGLFFSFVAGQGSWAGKMHLGVSPGAL